MDEIFLELGGLNQFVGMPQPLISHRPIADYLDTELPQPYTPDEEPQGSNSKCQCCGYPTSQRNSISADPSQQSNSGRVWYPCINGHCKIGRAKLLERDFVTFDCHGDNPNCDCAVPSRQGVYIPGREDVQGTGGMRPGYGYWNCAYGSCKYFSRDLHGRSVENGEVRRRDVMPFIPWLPSYSR